MIIRRFTYFYQKECLILVGRHEEQRSEKGSRVNDKYIVVNAFLATSLGIGFYDFVVS